MSKKIPTIGKVWLILMIIIQGIGVFTSIISAFSSPWFILIALAEAGAVACIIMLLLEKGLPFLIGYYICYGIATIVSQINMLKIEQNISFIIGMIIGLSINYLLTFLAVKNTLKKQKRKTRKTKKKNKKIQK